MANNLVVKALNILLASEYVILIQTRSAHWNLEDSSFGPFHELFGNQYEELAELADEIAERVRQLDGTALGSMQEFIENAIVKETSAKISSAKEFLSNLISLHESFISGSRRNLEKFDKNDPVTANMLQDWIAKHEKMLWFLKAHYGKNNS